MYVSYHLTDKHSVITCGSDKSDTVSVAYSDVIFRVLAEEEREEEKRQRR